MRTAIVTVAVVKILMATAMPAVAEDSQESNSGWRLIIENDTLGNSLTNANDDRNYTMGVTVSISGEQQGNGWFARALDTFDRNLFPAKGGEVKDEEAFALDFGVSAFTPNDLEDPQPIQGDRPYACLTFMAKDRVAAYQDLAEQQAGEGYAHHTKLVIGILGLDICKAVQRWLHNDVGLSPQDPLGWGNQISDGGEPTGMYSSEYLQLRLRANNETCTKYEIASNYGYNLGYYSNVFAGGTLRVGRVCSPYYFGGANPNSWFAQAPGTRASPDSASIETDHYLIIGYQARLIGYNALLQGQFRDSAVTLSGSEISRLVHEASAGWTYQFRSGSAFTYALQYHSSEIRGSFSRSHWYGSLVFSKVF